MIGHNHRGHEENLRLDRPPTTRADTRQAWRSFGISLVVVAAAIAGLWFWAGQSEAANARGAAGEFQETLWAGETERAWRLVADQVGSGPSPEFRSWAADCRSGMPGDPGGWAMTSEPVSDGGYRVTLDPGSGGGTVTYRVVSTDPHDLGTGLGERELFRAAQNAGRGLLGWAIAGWSPDLTCTP